jgi:hypothetical protein
MMEDIRSDERAAEREALRELAALAGDDYRRDMREELRARQREACEAGIAALPRPRRPAAARL